MDNLLMSFIEQAFEAPTQMATAFWPTRFLTYINNTIKSCCIQYAEAINSLGMCLLRTSICKPKLSPPAVHWKYCTFKTLHQF